jgi:uncharacterized membrane protein
MENIKIYIDFIANIVEAVGVLTIFFGVLFSIGKYLLSLRKPEPETFVGLRHAIGKSILLGLEILIAADIMATVVTEPTLNSVFVLGLIVFIRTILSLSLQVELDGKFPWQRTKIEKS